ncbi:MAG: hypothetical protein AMXMBFR46_16450 [Acidimicrobiia bacterium]
MSELEAGIVGSDPALLTTFYERALGFEVVDRLELDAFGLVLKLRRGAARIKLFFPQPPASQRVEAEPWQDCAGWRYAALYLESPEALQGIVAAVDAAGGSVLLEPSSHRPGATVAVVRDPEGNVWELLAEVAS